MTDCFTVCWLCGAVIFVTGLPNKGGSDGTAETLPTAPKNEFDVDVGMSHRSSSGTTLQETTGWWLM
eukprot:6008766-Pyramimonas_sp.AAC.1